MNFVFAICFSQSGKRIMIAVKFECEIPNVRVLMEMFKGWR